MSENLKVRFSVNVNDIKGRVVKAPEGVAKHKIVFVLGYRPERRKNWLGELPRDGQVWDCELVRDTQPGSRKGALLVRLIRRDPKEWLLEEAVATPNYWGEPRFIAVETSYHPGWFPGSDYDYYPCLIKQEEVEEAGLEVQRIDNFLIYKDPKTGKTVSGRSVNLVNGDLKVSDSPERVHGILPPEADFGFYYHTNAKGWQKCHIVEIHITSLKTEEEEIPAYARRVGLETTMTGELVKLQEESFRNFSPDLHFLDFTYLETGEVSGFPVRETVVKFNFSFFSATMRYKFLEPRLTKGIAPELEEVLETNNLKIRKFRTKEGTRIEVSGLDLGLEVYGEDILLQRAPGRTFICLKKDPRVRDLISRVEKLEYSFGPREEEYNRLTGGRYFIQWKTGMSTADWSICSPYGIEIGYRREKSEERALEISWTRREILRQKDFLDHDPFHQDLGEKIYPQLILVREGSVLHTEYGIQPGFVEIDEAKKKVADRN